MPNGLRLLEHGRRHECAGLQETRALELEDEAFRYDDRSVAQERVKVGGHPQV
jgi:hypothetical protein